MNPTLHELVLLYNLANQTKMVLVVIRRPDWLVVSILRSIRKHSMLIAWADQLSIHWILNESLLLISYTYTHISKLLLHVQVIYLITLWLPRCHCYFIYSLSKLSQIILLIKIEPLWGKVLIGHICPSLFLINILTHRLAKTGPSVILLCLNKWETILHLVNGESPGGKG